MSDVVALVDDLFFQAKLTETARLAGVNVELVATGEALLAAAADHPRLVLVDLNARQAPFEAIERLCNSGNAPRVIGFFSHVQTDLAERARSAGCTQVLPRSKFTANLADILRQAIV